MPTRAWQYEDTALPGRPLSLTEQVTGDAARITERFVYAGNADAAFSGIRTVTHKTRNGMIVSLRVLKTCRKTAISARRVALQIIHSNIISAPDELREQLRNMTCMQLIRTLGSWRPDASEYRNVTNVYRISLKSLARRYLELHDEIADLDVMIAAIVDELAPELIKRNAIGYESASQLLITAGDNPQRLRSESGLLHCVVSARFLSLQEKRTVIDLIGVEIVLQIVHFTSSLSDVYELTIKRRNMLPGE
ncbi:Uncharacterised protein [Enterobacter cancerogenus]|uniref:Uncharacterized protein n=1 Tax=Enterobacter cancerogenus TaxID=69218 RepID=A0A484WW43_9ENTR|nr:Uncharacterised protein [Enterobacter cancerogenus]